jgi:dihydroorotate dehydrogenase
MTLLDLAQRCLQLLDPETAHRATIWALRRGLAPRVRASDDPRLAIRLWDRDFPNPIGMAAGFDKDARVPGPLLGLGFGFVEVGTLTPHAQAGNPRPRVFRLPEDGAVINRLGFNNRGAAAAWTALEGWRGAGGTGLVGVNIGKNRDSADAAADYAAAAELLAPAADYLTINVSSPNTPGLRALQGRAELEGLIDGLRAALDGLASVPPLLLKVAPDLDEDGLADIAEVALERRLDGLIATNTTVERPPGLVGGDRMEAGGLSGRPLFARSTEVLGQLHRLTEGRMPLMTEVLGQLHRLTEGRMPLIGVGGVASGAEAYAKIRAGASLVQLYTALIYQGPGLVARIKAELADLLARDGFASVADAVGVDRG